MDVVNVSGGEFIMKVQKVFRKYAVLIIIVISNN